MSTLPSGVYATKRDFRVYVRRGGQRFHKRGRDIASLQQALKEWHVKLDMEGIPKTRIIKPADFQSKVPGVTWDPRQKKWRGQCLDRLKGKNISTSYFTDENDCAEALQRLREMETLAFQSEIEKRIREDPLVRDLEKAPDDIQDALPGKAYCCVGPQNHYVPSRVVVTNLQTHREYRKACEKCTQRAYTGRDGTTRFCVQHGGGFRCLGYKGEECPYNIAVNRGKGDIYSGHCVRCFCAQFPDDERAKTAKGYIHAKEQAVTKVLEAAFPDYSWTFDKVYNHSTGRTRMLGRFRPDARIRIADRVLIVEVDEDSHRGYMCSKEREREESFVRQAAPLTVILIRFNPDKYIDFEGKTHPSCFHRSDKESIVSVNPRQQKQWDNRLDTLKNTIDYVLNPKSDLPPKQEDRPCLTIELFYDNISDRPEAERIKAEKQKMKAIGKRKRELADLISSSESVL